MERGSYSREREISRCREPRPEYLDRHSFRGLFYSRGMSASEVMEFLGLEPAHVGTLMRIHDVDGFAHAGVMDNRVYSLKQALTEEEWRQVVG